MPDRSPLPRASWLLALLLILSAIVVTQVNTRFLPAGMSLFEPSAPVILGAPTPWAQFSGSVGQKIIDVLRQHVIATPQAMVISFYVGPHGHVRKPVILRSSGDPRIDALVINQILIGMPLNQPPPSGVRMPLVIRFSIAPGGWIYSLEQTPP